VLNDVLDGYVSLANARKCYKVAIVRKGNRFRIDSAATKRLRKNLKEGHKSVNVS